MPNTPLASLPYPAATDPVADGATNFQALATALDALLSAGYYEKVTAEQITTTATWTNFTTVLEFTCTAAGVHVVEFGTYWDGGGANTGRLGIGLNGAAPPADPSPRIMEFTGGNMSRMFAITLAVGDKLKQWGYDLRTSARQGTFTKRYMRVQRSPLIAGSTPVLALAEFLELEPPDAFTDDE